MSSGLYHRLAGITVWNGPCTAEVLPDGDGGAFLSFTHSVSQSDDEILHTEDNDFTIPLGGYVASMPLQSGDFYVFLLEDRLGLRDAFEIAATPNSSEPDGGIQSIMTFVGNVAAAAAKSRPVTGDACQTNPHGNDIVGSEVEVVFDLEPQKDTSSLDILDDDSNTGKCTLQSNEFVHDTDTVTSNSTSTNNTRIMKSRDEASCEDASEFEMNPVDMIAYERNDNLDVNYGPMEDLQVEAAIEPSSDIDLQVETAIESSYEMNCVQVEEDTIGAIEKNPVDSAASERSSSLDKKPGTREAPQREVSEETISIVDNKNTDTSFSKETLENASRNHSTPLETRPYLEDSVCVNEFNSDENDISTEKRSAFHSTGASITMDRRQLGVQIGNTSDEYGGKDSAARATFWAMESTTRIRSRQSVSFALPSNDKGSGVEDTWASDDNDSARSDSESWDCDTWSNDLEPEHLGKNSFNSTRFSTDIDSDPAQWDAPSWPDRAAELFDSLDAETQDEVSELRRAVVEVEVAGEPYSASCTDSSESTKTGHHSGPASPRHLPSLPLERAIKRVARALEALSPPNYYETAAAIKCGPNISSSPLAFSTRNAFAISWHAALRSPHQKILDARDKTSKSSIAKATTPVNLVACVVLRRLVPLLLQALQPQWRGTGQPLSEDLLDAIRAAHAFWLPPWRNVSALESDTAKALGSAGCWESWVAPVLVAAEDAVADASAAAAIRDRDLAVSRDGGGSNEAPALATGLAHGSSGALALLTHLLDGCAVCRVTPVGSETMSNQSSAEQQVLEPGQASPVEMQEQQQQRQQQQQALLSRAALLANQVLRQHASADAATAFNALSLLQRVADASPSPTWARPNAFPEGSSSGTSNNNSDHSSKNDQIEHTNLLAAAAAYDLPTLKLCCLALVAHHADALLCAAALPLIDQLACGCVYASATTGKAKLPKESTPTISSSSSSREADSPLLRQRLTWRRSRALKATAAVLALLLRLDVPVVVAAALTKHRRDVSVLRIGFRLLARLVTSGLIAAQPLVLRWLLGSSSTKSKSSHLASSNFASMAAISRGKSSDDPRGECVVDLAADTLRTYGPLPPKKARHAKRNEKRQGAAAGRNNNSNSIDGNSTTRSNSNSVCAAACALLDAMAQTASPSLDHNSSNYSSKVASYLVRSGAAEALGELLGSAAAAAAVNAAQARKVSEKAARAANARANRRAEDKQWRTMQGGGKSGNGSDLSSSGSEKSDDSDGGIEDDDMSRGSSSGASTSSTMKQARLVDAAPTTDTNCQSPDGSYASCVVPALSALLALVGESNTSNKPKDQASIDTATAQATASQMRADQRRGRHRGALIGAGLHTQVAAFLSWALHARQQKGTWSDFSGQDHRHHHKAGNSAGGSADVATALRVLAGLAAPSPRSHTGGGGSGGGDGNEDSSDGSSDCDLCRRAMFEAKVPLVVAAILVSCLAQGRDNEVGGSSGASRDGVGGEAAVVEAACLLLTHLSAPPSPQHAAEPLDKKRAMMVKKRSDSDQPGDGTATVRMSYYRPAAVLAADAGIVYLLHHVLEEFGLPDSNEESSSTSNHRPNQSNRGDTADASAAQIGEMSQTSDRAAATTTAAASRDGVAVAALSTLRNLLAPCGLHDDRDAIMRRESFVQAGGIHILVRILWHPPSPTKKGTFAVPQERSSPLLDSSGKVASTAVGALGADCLALLAADPSQQIDLIEAGAPQALVQLLLAHDIHRENTGDLASTSSEGNSSSSSDDNSSRGASAQEVSVVRACLAALANLCTDGGTQGDDAREAVYQARGYDAAVKCLRTHATDRTTALAGLAFLRNASGSADTTTDRSRSLLVKSGAVEAVIGVLNALMRSDQDDYDGDGLSQTMTEVGARVHSSNFLEEEAAPVCAQAAAALFNLAVGRDLGAKWRRDSIVMAGGHRKLVAALMAFGDRPQVSRLCLGALWALTSDDSNENDEGDEEDSEKKGARSGSVLSNKKNEENSGEDDEDKDNSTGFSSWLPETVAGCLAPLPQLQHLAAEVDNNGSSEVGASVSTRSGLDSREGASGPDANTPASLSEEHTPSPSSPKVSPPSAPLLQKESQVLEAPQPPPLKVHSTSRRSRKRATHHRLGTGKRCAAVVAAGGHVAACASLQSLRLTVKREVDAAAARAMASVDALSLKGNQNTSNKRDSEESDSEVGSSGGVVVHESSPTSSSWLGAAVGKWLPWSNNDDDPAEVEEAKARVAASQAAAAAAASTAARSGGHAEVDSSATAAASDAAVAAAEDVGFAFLENLDEGLGAALREDDNGNDNGNNSTEDAGSSSSQAAANGDSDEAPRKSALKAVYARARADVYAIRRQCGLAEE